MIAYYNLAFPFDFIEHLNELNMKLQERAFESGTRRCE